ncbi:MAG: PhnD/SsuA/transferrin family substrate-binding protein [Gammaproteobacteria bacterium]|nr:PhnD/SsuA/transferrin family substrate-binding protein [Gammaproteobacteria bacterium]
MTASFPWYDLASVRWANDVLWRAMGLGGELDRTTPVDAQWRADGLVVSQACGLDLFVGDWPIEPVLAPVFDLDCLPGHYFSYVVGTCEAPSNGGVAAVNSLSSRSGFTALLSVCTPRSMIVTGSHEASLSALARGAATVACIDAVTWHILERDAPALVEGFDVLERTASAPAPPYVVRRNGKPDRLVRRMTAAMQNPATRLARRALLLHGVIPVARSDYAPVLTEYRAVAERIPPLLMACGR